MYQSHKSVFHNYASPYPQCWVHWQRHTGPKVSLTLSGDLSAIQIVQEKIFNSTTKKSKLLQDFSSSSIYILILLSCYNPNIFSGQSSVFRQCIGCCGNFREYLGFRQHLGQSSVFWQCIGKYGNFRHLGFVRQHLGWSSVLDNVSAAVTTSDNILASDISASLVSQISASDNFSASLVSSDNIVATVATSENIPASDTSASLVTSDISSSDDVLAGLVTSDNTSVGVLLNSTCLIRWTLTFGFLGVDVNVKFFISVLIL